MKQLGIWVANGLAHCVLVFFIPTGIFGATGMEDHGVYGTTVMNAMVIAVNLRLVLAENHISWVMHAVVGISVLAFYLWAAILQSLWPTLAFDEFSGPQPRSSLSPLFPLPHALRLREHQDNSAGVCWEEGGKRKLT